MPAAHRRFAAVGVILGILAGAGSLLAADGAVAANKGLGLLGAGRAKEAIAPLTEAIAADPRNDDYYVYRAIAWFEQGRYAQALDDVDKSLGLNPKNANAYHTRGNILHHYGRYGQAIAHYDKTAQLTADKDLRELARKNAANSRRSHDSVFKGELKAPGDDLPALAKEGPAREKPMAFWASVGAVDDLTMRTEDKIPGTDRILKKTITLKCVRVEVPRKGMPLSVWLPLERGEILYLTVKISCEPGVAILLGSRDPFGVYDTNVKLYLEWLYYKSGLPQQAAAPGK